MGQNALGQSDCRILNVISQERSDFGLRSTSNFPTSWYYCFMNRHAQSIQNNKSAIF